MGVLIVARHQWPQRLQFRHVLQRLRPVAVLTALSCMGMIHFISPADADTDTIADTPAGAVTDAPADNPAATIVAAVTDTPADTPADPLVIDEAQEEGTLDLLEEMGILDLLNGAGYLEAADSVTSAPEHIRPDPAFAKSTGLQKFSNSWSHRISLRWVHSSTTEPLRFKGSAGWSGGRFPLHGDLLLKTNPEKISGANVKGSLAAGPFQAGHLELSWAEGLILSLGERDPGWGGRLALSPMAMRVKKWSWLGEIEPPIVGAGAVTPPGLRRLTIGGLWARKPSRGEKNCEIDGGAQPEAFSTIHGAWILFDLFHSTPNPSSWLGVLLLKTTPRPIPLLSLAGSHAGPRGRVSYEMAGEDRIEAWALSALWKGNRDMPSLKRLEVAFRWDREVDWEWSCDPRRPPTGRVRMMRVAAEWRLRPGATMQLHAANEARWTDAKPLPTHRRDLNLYISFTRGIPFQPTLGLAVRHSLEPRWTQGLGRRLTADLSRLTCNLHLLDNASRSIGLRAGLGQSTSETEPGSAGDGTALDAGPSKGNHFVEFHGSERSPRGSLQWVAGRGSGDTGGTRWIGLFPDPSGWIPIPTTSPSLWLGMGIRRLAGGIHWGAGWRMHLMGGEIRSGGAVSVTWQAQ